MAVNASFLYESEIEVSQGGDAGRFYRRVTYFLLAIIVLAALVGIVVPAGLGWDFANFYDTGRRAAALQIADIYKPDTLIAGVKPQGAMPFWGAPISAFFYAPLSLFSPEVALFLFKFQNTAAYFLALWLLYPQLRRLVEPSPEAQWKFSALYAGAILVFQPFWAIYRIGGQSMPTVFLLLTIALVYHTKGRTDVSANSLFLALLIKPGFVFVLLPLCLVSGWKFLRSLAFTSIAVGVVSILLLGWDIHMEFLQVMVQGLKNAYPWLYNSSLYVQAENLRLLANPPVDIRLLAVPMMLVKLAMVLLFGWFYWISRKELWSMAARLHFDFLMAVTFCLMFSQTVWEHYLTALFLLLIYLVTVARRFSFNALVLLGAIFFTSLMQNIIVVNVLNSHFRFDSIPELIAIGLLKSCPLWLTILFLILHQKEFFQSFSMPQWEKIPVVSR